MKRIGMLLIALGLGGCGGAQSAATHSTFGLRPAPRWNVVAMAGTGVSIDFPCETQLTDTPAVEGQSVASHMIDCGLGEDVAFNLAYSDQNVSDFVAIAPETIFQNSAALTAQNIHGQLGEHQMLTVNDHAAAEFYVANPQLVARSRVVIVGTRLYQFTVVGNDTDVHGPTAERFFSSVQFRPLPSAPPAERFTTFRPPGSDFAVDFPGTPLSKAQPAPAEGGPATLQLTIDSPEEARSYAVIRTGPIPNMTHDNAAEMVARVTEAFANDMHLQAPAGTDTVVAGWPLRETTIPGKNGLVIRTRVYAADQVVYLQMFVGTPRDARSQPIDNFFDSFHHVAPGGVRGAPTSHTAPISRPQTRSRRH